MSGRFASARDPTGRPSSTKRSTTKLRIWLWRSVSTERIVGTLVGGQLCLGVPDHLIVALGGDRVDDHAPVAGLLDRAADHQLLLGEAHAAELDREALERARVAAGELGVAAGDLGHHPEAMQDVAGQADPLGELRVDVDRVEVPGRAGVAM